MFCRVKQAPELPVGGDFRRPEYRREVFLRFYDFHLRFRSHPGGVYYLMPYLAAEYNWDTETKLWYAFINGCTQHPVTSLVIFRRFPRLPETSDELRELRDWFNLHWGVLQFDTDRRYQKKDFPNAVTCYSQLTHEAGSQARLFEGKSFAELWKMVRGRFLSFGRLASFSYLEYIRIMGVGPECDTLFLDDLEGSKSHRNGLARVLGRDDLDWHKSTGFDGKYPSGTIDWLKFEAECLLEEARERIAHPDVGYFTLESTLCCFKSWFRKNRRYPGVYNDMLYDRILSMQSRWPTQDFTVFWKAREAALPDYLRVECDPTDPGLVPAKQNHFRETGEVIAMGNIWPEFTDSGTWRKK